MARKPATVILAYNGIDGACAAAAACLRFPAATVVIGSARSIGDCLETIRSDRRPVAEVHVCGLGVYGDWAEVERPASAIGKTGARVLWYCGRGYLEDRKRAFARFCAPVFLNLGSNTRAVCRHLAVEDNPQAKFLCRLAKHDPQIGLGDSQPDADTRFWLDLVSASFAEYAKYRDPERYIATIRKLAERRHDAADRRLIEVYRQCGFRYAMQGRSRALRRVQELIRKCAAVDDPLLVLGESGVGKEHVAHLIHERGRRATEPFVAVNCAAFAGNAGLANRALFGHCKGAFTGAVARRAGAFPTANGGVLFLDELGQLPPEVQGKLLRVLEDGLVTPEGSDRPVGPVDVRVIGATNADLPGMIGRREFREDLFYRLAALRIVIPPLRDRRDDIDPIVDNILEELAEERRPHKLRRQDRQALRHCDWPGNVRQLRHVVRRIAVLNTPVAKAIADDVKLARPASAACDDGEPLLPQSPDEIRPIKEIQLRYTRQALSLYGGNLRETAYALGIALNTLRNWLRQR